MRSAWLGSWTSSVASGTGKLTLRGGVVERASCIERRSQGSFDSISGMRLLVLLFTSALALAQRTPGSPLDHLPPDIEVLTHFGERADISPDNQRVAFMTKSFGDAMVIDLKSRIIQCLTCNIPGAAFLRVMHLVTGDYILIGPDHFEDVHTSRSRDNELWFLSKERGAKPVKLGQKISEGAAISKKSLKIAFSELPA